MTIVMKKSYCYSSGPEKSLNYYSSCKHCLYITKQK